MYPSVFQLTTEGCGSTSTCFYGKSCKSNIDCDYFIKFTYNAVSKSVSFAIGGKHDWVAFGLRDEKKLSMVNIGFDFIVVTFLSIALYNIVD